MSELYELPTGWEWRAFEDIFVNISSKPYQVKKSEYLDSGLLPIIDQGKRFIIGYSNAIDKKYLNNSNCIIFGDHTRQVKYLEFDFVIGADGTKILKEKDSSICDLKFLYFQLLSKNIKSLGYSRHFKLIKKMSFYLPPLPEQKRIVAKLDTLFAKIDQAIILHQQNIDESDKFMGSVLNEVFGELEEKYEKQILVFFDKKMSAGGTPLRKEKDYWNGDIEWFSSGELNQLYTLPANEKITQIGLKKSSAKLFKKGTLLIGMYDTAAMKMSILSNDGSCNQAIVGFNPKEDELNIFFVKYQLEYLKENILEQRQGVRQKNLNLSKLKNIEIEFPPLKTQQKTVTYLDQLSQKTEILKQVQKEKLENLKALKASILDKAFRGEL
jgi:type I restriction enzyme S subunit